MTPCKIGDVVKIVDPMSQYFGFFALVYGVKKWGVKAFLKLDDGSEIAFRLKKGDFIKVGEFRKDGNGIRLVHDLDNKKMGGEPKPLRLGYNLMG